MATVKDLYQHIRNTARRCRHLDSKFNGKEFWFTIKNILSTSKYVAPRWIPQLLTRYNGENSQNREGI